MIIDHRGARAGIIRIGVTGSHARVALDQDLVAALNQLVRRRRQESYTVLLIFDFFRNADTHILLCLRISSRTYSTHGNHPAPCRLKIGDTAECNSGLPGEIFWRGSVGYVFG